MPRPASHPCGSYLASLSVVSAYVVHVKRERERDQGEGERKLD